MPLPTIMFCENHQDTATPKLLLKLLPSLIQAGYTVFLYEIPVDTDIHDLSSQNEYSQQLWSLCKSKCGIGAGVKDDYLFVYPFSQPAIVHEEPFRQGGIDFPLGLHLVDLSDEKQALLRLCRY